MGRAPFLERLASYSFDAGFEVFGTTIWSSTLLYFIALFVNGLFVSFLLDHLIEDQSGLNAISTSLTALTALVGVKYNEWMRTIIGGRYNALESYFNILNSLSNVHNISAFL